MGEKLIWLMTTLFFIGAGIIYILPADGLPDYSNNNTTPVSNSTGKQKADAGMYANLPPEVAAFYERNNLQIPTAQEAAAATQRSNKIRNMHGRLTKLALVVASVAALAGLVPMGLAWTLASPEVATKPGQADGKMEQAKNTIPETKDTELAATQVSVDDKLRL